MSQINLLSLEARKKFLQKYVNFHKYDGVIQELIIPNGFEVSLAEDLIKCIEALEYYAKDLEYTDVTYTNNYCHDDCPKDCEKHTYETKGRSRPACHSKSKALEVLTQVTRESGE